MLSEATLQLKPIGFLLSQIRSLVISFSKLTYFGRCPQQGLITLSKRWLANDRQKASVLEFMGSQEADMKREMERKELERKRSPKVEFVSWGTQISVAGISAAVTSGLQSATITAPDATKEVRNKKSKWDKIDGDVKHPVVLPGGNDKITGHDVHASHLSAANAGAGYNAFAQQKRREAEEKKSSERRPDRRS